MKLNIEPSHFLEIINRQYNLDVIYLLKLIEDNIDVKKLCENSEKIAALYVSLIRKGLITEIDNNLTILGKELLEFINTKGENKLAKHKPSPEFDEWWKAFPGTDTWREDGCFFSGHRTLRQDKENCKTEFNKILLEGEYTSQQLINALIIDVKMKKSASLKTGQNKLSYMHNSRTYLNQRSYEPYIEMLTENIEESSSTGGVDI